MSREGAWIREEKRKADRHRRKEKQVWGRKVARNEVKEIVR